MAGEACRDTVIAKPNEITQTDIRVAEIAEIFDERFGDSVIAGLEQLAGRQIGEAESSQ